MIFRLSAFMFVFVFKRKKLKRAIRRENKFQVSFMTLKIFAIVAILGLILLSGCSGQEIYVYEKLPEVSECRRFKDYWTVSACNRKNFQCHERYLKFIFTPDRPF